MDLINLTGKITEAQPKTLRTLSAKECRQVRGGLSEPLVERYRSPPTSGDRLRLPTTRR